MALSHQRAGNLATITATGDHPESDFGALVSAIIRESDGASPLRLIFDVRAFQRVPDAESLRRVAMRMAGLRPQLDDRHAFVVSNKYQFGLAHEVVGWAGTRGVKVGIFRAVEDAQAWLADGLPESGDGPSRIGRGHADDSPPEARK